MTYFPYVYLFFDVSFLVSTFPCDSFVFLYVTSSFLSGEASSSLLRTLVRLYGVNRGKASRLRQTANANLYHVAKFPLHLSFTVHYYYT